MTNPWDADRPVDAAAARALIEEHFFAPESVAYFAEGWDFFVFEADGWLFRIPKREQERARLRFEVGLLAGLADRLPIPVPRYQHVADALAGYRKLEGDLATGANLPERFAEDLAALLTALHAVEPATLADAFIESAWTPSAAHASQRREFEEARDALAPGLRAACLRHLDAEPPPNTAGPPRMTHNDLFPEHIVVDETGIAGILDWADACPGDPSADFGAAYFLGGEPLLRATLERYRGDADAKRARFCGRGMAVGYVLYGARSGRTRYLEEGRGALHRIGLHE